MKGANPQQLEHYVKQHSGEEGASASTPTKKNVGVPGYVSACKLICQRVYSYGVGK
jgi:hypothetical protein